MLRRIIERLVSWIIYVVMEIAFTLKIRTSKPEPSIAPVPLIEAIRAGDTETVRNLLKSGVDPNTRVPITGVSSTVFNIPVLEERYADSALILAVKGRNEEITRLLLEHGADINFINTGGSFALGSAVIMNSARMVRLLLDRGADVNLCDSDKDTALILATESVYENLVTLLLERGADPNITGTEDATALMYAAEGGQTDILRALLQAGAKVNNRDADGHTALWFAKQNNKREAIRLLIAAGASE